MGNREEQRNTMLDDGKKDRKWREKILEEDPGLWTVECLRGRLLAERVASKATKQNAELMENKLIELEQKLKLELKLRNKAEQKLKLLMGKLESLKISTVGLYLSSVDTEDYSSSSTASSSITTVDEITPVCQKEKLMKCSTEKEMWDTTDSMSASRVSEHNYSERSNADLSPHAHSISSSRSSCVSCETDDRNTCLQETNKMSVQVKSG